MGTSSALILVVFGPYLVIFGQPSASEVLQVESGGSVRLPCSSGNSSVVVLQWFRVDLKDSGYVFFYRDGHPYPSYQHKLFSGRIELSDPQMKGGDMSVVLNNVSATDNGEYVCQIALGNRQGEKMSDRQRIMLEVKDKASTHQSRQATEGRNLGVHVHPPAGLLLLLLLLLNVF